MIKISSYHVYHLCINLLFISCIKYDVSGNFFLIVVFNNLQQDKIFFNNVKSIYNLLDEIVIFFQNQKKFKGMWNSNVLANAYVAS